MFTMAAGFELEKKPGHSDFSVLPTLHWWKLAEPISSRNPLKNHCGRFALIRTADGDVLGVIKETFKRSQKRVTADETALGRPYGTLINVFPLPARPELIEHAYELRGGARTCPTTKQTHCAPTTHAVNRTTNKP